MSRLCSTTLLMFLIAVSPPGAADTRHAVGVSTLAVDQPPRAARPLNGHIWYPAVAKGEPQRFGESPVWYGFEAYHDAPVAEGRFPLVVLSHGLNGNSRNQAWLATRLAEAGVVVVAPNHPGTTTFDRSPAARARLWARAEDLSRTITAMAQHPVFGASVQTDRVAAIGHSLGGFAVLAAAGARISIDHHEAYCARYPGSGDCILAYEIGLFGASVDRVTAEAPYGDARVAAVVTLDVGGVQAFDPASLARIAPPVLVIGAGRDDGLVAIERESHALVARVPSGSDRYLELPVGHLDFLNVCKPNAQSFIEIEEPGDDIVCRNAGPARAAAHLRVFDAVVGFLDEVGILAVTP